MCIFLSRHFACHVNGADDTHTHQYLVRCANPLYELCIKRDVLPTWEETFGFPCHACTGKFIEPVRNPLSVKMPITQMCAGEKEAIYSYVEALCDVMIASTVRRWPSIPDDTEHFKLYRTSRMEMACRFNKNHFDKGGLCDCNETNMEPELHNIAVAMRQTVSRAYLYPKEGTYPRPRLVNNRIEYIDESKDEYAWSDPHNEGYTFRHQAQAKMAGQPDLSQLKYLKQPTSVGDIQVIPFHMDIFADREAHKMRTEGLNVPWKMSQGSKEAFYTTVLGQYGHQGVDELYYRICLVDTAQHLVSNDPGLLITRMSFIVHIFLNVVLLGTDDWGTYPLDTPLTPACADKLAELCRKGRRLTQNRTLPSGEFERFGGDAWFNELQLLEMQEYFRRSRSLRKDDELARATAIQNTVEPLSEEEVAALSEDEIACVVCGEDMEYPLGGHAAMRLRCPSGHLVGMNCWMKTWRKKRLVQMGEDGIQCHSCACFKVGEWRPVIPRSRAFLQGPNGR